MQIERLFFLNRSATPPLPLTRLQRGLKILRDVWVLIVVFVCVIFGCTVLYYFGSKHGWGIQPTFIVGPTNVNVVAKPDFFDCLHFSVVTIATLGYGDFRPESYGRLVSALEVIAGIVLAGLFVSRLVSRQQDRFTKRLVMGQLNREIQDFRDILSDLLNGFGSAPAIQRNQPSEILYKVSGLCQSIGRYWRYQAKEPDLAEILQVRAADRLLGDLISLLERIDSYTGEKSKTAVCKDDRICIRNITESILTVSTALSSQIENEGILHSHSKISELVTKLRTQLLLHES